MKKDIIKINEKQLKGLIFEGINNFFSSFKDEELDIENIFNFSSIPFDELEEQYVDLSVIVSSSGYGGKFMGVNGKILKENATKTLSITETKNEIQRKFKFKDWQFATQEGANKIRLVMLYPGILKNSKLIKEAMSACGWSLAYKTFTIKKGMIWRAMSFEPMFQNNVANEARQFKYLLHWTPLYNVKSIMEKGLIPRSENNLFDYPDRLHLIKGNVDKNELFNIGSQLCKVNDNKENYGDYVLFAIEMQQIPVETEFYYDPRYEWGYYVKTLIKSTAIKAILGYNFKTKEKFSV